MGGASRAVLLAGAAVVAVRWAHAGGPASLGVDSCSRLAHAVLRIQGCIAIYFFSAPQRESDNERADVVRLLMKLIVGGEWRHWWGVAPCSARAAALACRQALCRHATCHFIARQPMRKALVSLATALQWPASRSCRRWRSRRRTPTSATVSGQGLGLPVVPCRMRLAGAVTAQRQQLAWPSAHC